MPEKTTLSIRGGEKTTGEDVQRSKGAGRKGTDGKGGYKRSGLS